MKITEVFNFGVSSFKIIIVIDHNINHHSGSFNLIFVFKIINFLFIMIYIYIYNRFSTDIPPKNRPDMRNIYTMFYFFGMRILSAGGVFLKKEVNRYPDIQQFARVIVNVTAMFCDTN